MAKVGFLYSSGDNFSITRSELLVGPMILEGIDFFRFTQSDVADDLSVAAQRFQDNRWTSTSKIRLDALIDCSLVTEKRVENEVRLLNSIPSISSLKLDHYHALRALERDADFQGLLLPLMELKDYQTVLAARETWEKFAIKAKHPTNTSSIFIVEHQGSTWHVEEPNKVSELSKGKMQALIEGLGDRYYLQKYKDSKARNGRSISFSLVAQQRRDGAWRQPVVRGAISTEGDIASLQAGAEFIGTPLIFDEVPYFDYPSKYKSGNYINYKLQKAAVSLCRYLGDTFNHNLGAVGVKFGLDKYFEPFLFNVDLRTTSQSGPGKNLEFYKHLAELAHYVARPHNNINLPPSKAKPPRKNKEPPLSGASLRAKLSDEKADAVINGAYEWIDSSIGHGGREFMQRFARKDRSQAASAFYSVRVGYAGSDRTGSAGLSISALEDYLGAGLLSYKESEHMRSVRKRLVNAQWNQIERALEGVRPDVLFLEDVDLGLRGIREDDYISTLRETTDYLQHLSENSLVGGWGVTFYNAKSSISRRAIAALKEMAKTRNKFNYVGVNLPNLNIEIVNELASLAPRVIVFSDTVTINDISSSNLENVSVLKYLRNSQ